MAGFAGIFGLLLAVDGGAPPPPARPVPQLLAPVRNGGQTPPADEAYDLRPAKDKTGDLVYEGPGFTARVGRDGTARFRDKRLTLNLRWSLLPWVPLRMPRGTPTLQSAVEDLLAKRNPRRGEHIPGRDRTSPEPSLPIPNLSPYRPDPRADCRYPQPCFFELRPLVVNATVTFDVTDEIMRLSGQDPYRYEKARFLAATRELRTGLAARALAEDMRRAITELPSRVETIACDEHLPLRERRAIIEALRDEMDDGRMPAARDAVAQITRLLSAHFDAADGGVRCPPR